MACDEIVAEQLTVTGSIGVVAAKFNVQKLQEKIGVHYKFPLLVQFCEIHREH